MDDLVCHLWVLGFSGLRTTHHVSVYSVKWISFHYYTPVSILGQSKIKLYITKHFFLNYILTKHKRTQMGKL